MNSHVCRPLRNHSSSGIASHGGLANAWRSFGSLPLDGRGGGGVDDQVSLVTILGCRRPVAAPRGAIEFAPIYVLRIEAVLVHV